MSHEYIIDGDTFQVPLTADKVLTDLAASDTLFDELVPIDLTNYTEALFACNVLTAGNTGTVRVQYDDGGGVLADLTATVSLASTGAQSTGWAEIPAGARGPVVLNVTAAGGDESEDPRVFASLVHVRR